MRRCYGVATISRLLKVICLFCRISSLLQGSFAKETYIVRSLLIVATPYVNDSFFCDTILYHSSRGADVVWRTQNIAK